MTHICVSKLTIRRHAIIWTNDGISLIGPLGTIFNDILIEIHTFSFKKIHLKCRLENGVHFASASMCWCFFLMSWLRQGRRARASADMLLSGVPDFFDRNKILRGGDLSHYQVPHCMRVFFYFVWVVFIHHNFQLYFKLCTYRNLLDIYLS